mgnify:CR=1 FL=1
MASSSRISPSPLAAPGVEVPVSPTKRKTGLSKVFAPVRATRRFTTWLRRRTKTDAELHQLVLRLLMKRGWLVWRQRLLEKSRTYDSMRRSVSHMLNRMLSRGWLVWLDGFRSRAAVLAALRQGVARMMHSSLAHAFLAWVHTVPKPDNLLEKAARSALNLDLSRGWGGWHASWLEASRQREAMRRAVGRMLHGQLSLGWTAWLAMVERRAMVIGSLRKGARASAEVSDLPLSFAELR